MVNGNLSLYQEPRDLILVCFKEYIIINILENNMKYDIIRVIVTTKTTE